MRLSKKHENQQSLTFADFTGGMRQDISPVLLKPNMFQRAKNVELNYSTGKLDTVDGLVPVLTLPAKITKLFHNYKENYLMAACGTKIYKLPGYLSPVTQQQYIGELNGIARPSFDLFGKQVVFVSGDRVQYYSHDDGLQEAKSSPVSDMCFVRSGRLVVSATGSDIISYCGAGDIENWKFESSNDQDGKYVEIGYQDGGGIVAMRPLLGNIIIFKRSGKSYRLSGDHTSWFNYDLSDGVYAVGQHGVVFAGNGMYYIGKDGFYALGVNSGEYGTVKTAEVGSPINQQLMQGISQNAKVWDVTPKKQIWLQASELGVVYLFHYYNNSFTYRTFKVAISDVCVVGSTVYVAANDTIYRLDNSCDTEIDGAQIEVDLIGPLIKTKNSYLIKQVAASVDARGNVDAKVSIGRLELPIAYTAFSPLVNDCNGLVADADYPLWTLTRTTPEVKRQVYRTNEFAYRLTSTAGSFSLNSIDIEAVEV